MIVIVTGCNADRANELFARLQQRGAVILDRDNGEDIRMIDSFSVHNLGPDDVPYGAVVFGHGGKLTVKGSSGRTTAAVVKSRRKLRRVGGSDRLWRALRRGYPTR